MMYLIIAVLAIAILLTLKFLKKAKREDNGYKEGWFGKGPSPVEHKTSFEPNISIRPFKVEWSDDELADLRRRLEKTRFEDPVTDSKFLYGFNPNCMRNILDYWRNKYDWRTHEAELNKYPQFKTNIEGIDVHFIHVKPTLPENSSVAVLPLMVIHGWPGSVVEFYKLIPLLTTPRPESKFVFEVICPSIPGFGFSESPHVTGCNGRAIARMFVTLMGRLGHRKFFLQGGDWGSIISIIMSKYYASSVIGLHVNMFFAIPKSFDFLKMLLVSICPFLISAAEYRAFYPLKKKLRRMYEEMGYFHMNSTKPDTLGCAMSDSPAGMAAYLLEKFAVATNIEYLKREDGGLTEKFTMDELLTNVMVYWINNNFTAAARIYKESLSDIYKGTHERLPVTVPCGVAFFPNEVLMTPKILLSQHIKDLVSYNIMPRGGHFAALEEPELLANDVYNFVGLVQKRNGKF